MTIHTQPPDDLDAARSDVEQARADFYTLIGHLLLQTPSPALLESLAAADALCAADLSQDTRQQNSQFQHRGQPGRLASCWDQLVAAAAVMEAAAVRDEYDSLFTSTGTPALNPYASYYLAGFMMDKPLAALRRDLGQLGIARMQQATELEDHFGVLCETARLLIVQRRALAAQQRFLATHLFSWAGRFTEDLRQQPQANFYRVLADFIDAFIDLEIEAFAMDQTGEPA